MWLLLTVLHRRHCIAAQKLTAATPGWSFGLSNQRCCSVSIHSAITTPFFSLPQLTKSAPTCSSRCHRARLRRDKRPDEAYCRRNTSPRKHSTTASYPVRDLSRNFAPGCNLRCLRDRVRRRQGIFPGWHGRRSTFPGICDTIASSFGRDRSAYFARDRSSRCPYDRGSLPRDRPLGLDSRRSTFPGTCGTIANSIDPSWLACFRVQRSGAGSDIGTILVCESPGDESIGFGLSSGPYTHLRFVPLALPVLNGQNYRDHTSHFSVASGQGPRIATVGVEHEEI
jgi:hypothetical protein